MAALGGLVDTGREIAVVTGLARAPRAELPPAGGEAAPRFDRTPNRAPRRDRHQRELSCRAR